LTTTSITFCQSREFLIMEAYIVEYIRKAQEGDQEAFHSLVRIYDDRISGLIYSIVLNKQDAEDLYQEIFLKVWKKIHTFQFRSNFYSWLYRVTVNTCYNYTKKRSRHYWKDEIQITASTEFSSEGINLHNSEPHDALYNAINKLSPRLRTITIMHYFEGNTISNISMILKIGEGTIKKYLFRVREILRKELKQYAK